MAHKHGRPRSNGARGRMRGKGNIGRSQPRTDFKTSRLQDVEDAEDDASEVSEESSDLNVDAGQDETHSSDDEGSTPANSYTNLLRALNTGTDPNERASKRRKLDSDVLENGTNRHGARSISPRHKVNGGLPADNFEEENKLETSEEAHMDSDNEENMLQDPFEQHLGNRNESDIAAAIGSSKGKHFRSTTRTIGADVKETASLLESYQVARSAKNGEIHHINDLQLKQRLKNSATRILKQIHGNERLLMAEIFGYRDSIFGLRSLTNASSLRDIACLHAMNHVFKTRDRVLKNNARLSQENTGEVEVRDQGFTRPKVLFLLPTKQSCVRFVESVVKASEPEQQENKSRFLETFSQEDDESWENKPEDFRELFGGNNEEDFRIGLKFTRKTIKFFSGFYNSDMIFSSPLGLIRALTSSGGDSTDKKRAGDSDFLSSIEIVVMDNANAIEMQNWQHVEHVFSQLNLLPKESHGCDFSRARTWYLDGNARYFRQSIIFSSHLTPSINSLVSNHFFNIAGRVRYTHTYPGCITSLPARLPVAFTQTFLRFDSPSPLTDADARFNFFNASILTPLLRHKASSAKGTLIFIPTYADFVRLRNHFSSSISTASLSFGNLSEYSSKSDAARARSHFTSGRHSVLLYTERAHHYFRYRIRGVKRIIFYGVPENPAFWEELVSLLALDTSDGQDEEGTTNSNNRQGKGLVRAMFSKWDVLKLERIVGTERVGRLVNEKGGDVFEFV